MKRRISMLLIMLANMLILAHAVVPHHHHNQMFVAIINVLDDDVQDLFNHAHGHAQQHDIDNTDHHSPEHHHDSDSEECLMSEAEIAAALKLQMDDSGSWSVDLSQNTDDGGLIWQAAIELYELSYISENSEDHVKRRPYTASGHTDFVARSKGLRAPPFC